MAVTYTPFVNRYPADGSTTTFTYSFEISHAAHIKVLYDDIIMILGTNYAVFDVGNTNGGTIQFTTIPPVNTKITLIRNQPLSQLDSYLSNESYNPLKVQHGLDLAAMVDQMLAEKIQRSLKFAEKSDKVDVLVREPVALQITRWDSGANILESVGISDLGLGGTIATLNAGGVAFASSGTSLNTDAFNFFWDDINNRLGIGTNTPETPLHVKGDVTIYEAVSTGSAGHSLPSISLRNHDTVTPNGAGGFLRYEVPNSIGVMKDAAQINGGFIDATAGAEMGDIDFGVYRNGVVEVIGIQADLPAFVPSVNAVWDLGSITGHWRNLFLQGILDHSAADESALAGPLYVMTRISTTPAVNDAIGTILFRGRNFALGSVDYAGIIADIKDPTAGAEYGQLRLQTMVNGVLDSGAVVDPNIVSTQTALLIRNNKLGVLRFDRVVCGADDSGGAGFRMLRIAN